MKARLKMWLDVSWVAIRALMGLQSGVVAMVTLAVGLSWSLHSGVPLIVFGAIVVGTIVAMNAREHVLRERRRLEHEAQNAEHIEVVKLEYEHAVRAAKLGTGTPLEIVAAGAHAQAHGVTPDELEAIAERVLKTTDEPA